jgi:hypothetical protein
MTIITAGWRHLIADIGRMHRHGSYLGTFRRTAQWHRRCCEPLQGQAYSQDNGSYEFDQLLHVFLVCVRKFKAATVKLS